MLAGGLGTRVASLTGGRLPKALIEVGGRPFVDHKIEQLRAYGIEEVVLLVGHGSEALTAHVGDGSRYGIQVRCIPDGPELLGTGGAVRAALDELAPAFWLTYGDTLLAAPMPDIEAWFLASPYQSLMTVLHNRDQWEPSNVDVDGDVVAAYEKGRPPGTFEYIDYGLLLFRAEAFRAFPAGSAFDLGGVVRAEVAHRRMAAYVVDERFHDVGTPEAVAETDAVLRRRH